MLIRVLYRIQSHILRTHLLNTFNKNYIFQTRLYSVVGQMNTSTIANETIKITGFDDKETPQTMSTLISDLKKVLEQGYIKFPENASYFDRISKTIDDFDPGIKSKFKTVSFGKDEDIPNQSIQTQLQYSQHNPLKSSPVRTLIANETSIEIKEDPQNMKSETAMNIDLSLTQSSPSKKTIAFTQTRHLHMLTQRAEINQKTDDKVEDTTKHVAAINFSKEQEIVASLARRGENIFYTGSAGTGKSLLLKSLIKTLREQHHSEGGTAVAVTASTGLAACNIGGMTINSYTGIGLGKDSKEELLRKIKRNKVAKNRWSCLKVLIIDEVSMIDGHLLDKLEFIGRSIKSNKKPFGGIQVILCGDFYQLPPVPDKNNGGNIHQRKIFAFESQFWKEHVKVQVELKKIFRQASDKQFMEMLTDIRNGSVSAQTTTRFKNLERPLKIDTIEPTRLFSTRREVDYANHAKMKSLPGETITFEADDSGVDVRNEVGQKYLEQLLAPKSIQLKIGAQVMMVKNIDATLVNGSVGTVVGFVDSATYTAVTSICDSVDTMEHRNGSISINKMNMENAQGLKNSVFDFLGEAKERLNAEIKKKAEEFKLNTVPEANTVKMEQQSDIDKPFKSPLKATRQDNLQSEDSDFNPMMPRAAIAAEHVELDEMFGDTSEIVAGEDITKGEYSIGDFDDTNDGSVLDLFAKRNQIEQKIALVEALNRINPSPSEVRPVVQFKLASGDTRTVVVEREEFKWETEDANHVPTTRVQRVQLPLMLAWALSIHKSQGQTLSYVSVDLRNIFEDGQAYVALSRAVHRRGLQVLNFTPEKVTTSQKVVEFYKQLKDAETVFTEVSTKSTYSKSKTWASAPGIGTQVRDLYEITASPERFAKRKAELLLAQNDKKKKQDSELEDLRELHSHFRDEEFAMGDRVENLIHDLSDDNLDFITKFGNTFEERSD